MYLELKAEILNRPTQTVTFVMADRECLLAPVTHYHRTTPSTVSSLRLQKMGNDVLLGKLHHDWQLYLSNLWKAAIL